jgi:glyoxylase-like metal-dependent hydrolase (beta-lactamase superfamily II)
MSSTGIFRFSIGQYHCTSILDRKTEDGTVADITGSVSEQEWDRVLREHGYSPSVALVSSYNNLLIQTGKLNILVDAGIGQWIFPGGSALVERLADDGLSPANIDRIVLTHTDSDHVGGLLTAGDERQFPNARYILPKAIAEYWGDPEIVAGLDDDSAVFSRKILPALRDRVQIVPEGDEFLPGFRLHKAPGHRAGHTVLEITSDDETLLHLADTIGHPLLLEVPMWEWSYDENPDQAMQDKRELLGLAIRRNAMVFAAHMPYPGLGRVVKFGDGWKWVPVDQGG